MPGQARMKKAFLAIARQPGGPLPKTPDQVEGRLAGAGPFN